MVPRFCTNFMKHSILYRSAVRTNELFSDHFNNSCKFKRFSNEVKRDLVFKDFHFNSLSAQLVMDSLSK